MMTAKEDNTLHPFYTATRPLKQWLDINYFKYSVKSYQRNYEWGRTQVEGLLSSIYEICVANTGAKPENMLMLKIAEVVLLEYPPKREKQEFIRRLNGVSGPWYSSPSVRDVEIIDGQQRLTTMLILYAVLQYQLHRNLQAFNPSPEEAALVEEYKERIQELHDRFTGAHGDEFKLLVTTESFEGNRTLISHYRFPSRNATADALGDQLFDVLRSNDASAHKRTRELANAIWINRWLFNHLDAAAGTCAQEGTNGAGVRAAAAKNLKILINTLDTIDNYVVWTTTLTTSGRLALRTFVDYNSSISKVALSSPDVVKVAIIIGIQNQQGDGRGNLGDRSDALNQYRTCETLMGEVASTINGDRKLFPWLYLLGSKNELATARDGGAEKVTGKALMLDLLKHVRAICVARRYNFRESKDKLLPHALNDDESLQKFYALELNQLIQVIEGNSYSGLSFMREYVLYYGRALSTMLTGKWSNSVGHGGGHIPPASRKSLMTLLSLAENEWRPLVLVILRSLIGKSNRLPIGTLLNIALKQVEFIALHLACAKRRSAPLRHAVYSAAIRHILVADADNKLNEANFSGLKDIALTAIEDLPNTLKLGDGATKMLNNIYFMNVYKHSLPLSRAIFLSLESVGQNGGGGATRTRGGVVGQFEGSLTLEHILPQNPPVDLWLEFPVGSRGQYLHKLGNLTPLSQDLNNVLSNKAFDLKKNIIQEWERENMMQITKELIENYDTWNPENFISRHEELVIKLADRFDIDVDDATWRQWKRDLRQNLGIQEEELAEDLFVDDDDDDYDDGDDNDGASITSTDAHDYVAAAIKEPIRLNALTDTQRRALVEFHLEQYTDGSSPGLATWTPEQSSIVIEQLENEFPELKDLLTEALVQQYHENYLQTLQQDRSMNQSQEGSQTSSPPQWRPLNKLTKDQKIKLKAIMEDQEKKQAVWTLKSSESVAEEVASVLGIRVEPAAISRRHNRKKAAQQRKEARLQLKQELDEAKDPDGNGGEAAVEVANAGGDEAPEGGVADDGAVASFEDGLACIPIPTQIQEDGEDERGPGDNLTGHTHLLSVEQVTATNNLLTAAGAPPPPPPPGGTLIIMDEGIIDLRNLTAKQRELFLKLIRENENKGGSWSKKNSEAVIQGMEQGFKELLGRLDHAQIMNYYYRSKRFRNKVTPAEAQPTAVQPMECCKNCIREIIGEQTPLDDWSWSKERGTAVMQKLQAEFLELKEQMDDSKLFQERIRRIYNRLKRDEERKRQAPGGDGGDNDGGGDDGAGPSKRPKKG